MGLLKILWGARIKVNDVTKMTCELLLNLIVFSTTEDWIMLKFMAYLIANEKK